MPFSALDAYMLLRFSDDFRRRLSDAEAVLGQRRALTDETAWLAAAIARMEQACGDVPAALERAHLLPELESLRGDYAAGFQHLYVDALEKLLAGITFHVSGRAPIIEALFPPLKLPALRKATKEVVEKYARELEKRTKGSYVTRMCATADYAFIHPVLEQVRGVYAQWEAAFAASPLEPDAAAAVTERLVEVAERVELAMNQARLLAEAALLPVAGAFEDLGLGFKPKRRSGSKSTGAPSATAAREEGDGGGGAEEAGWAAQQEGGDGEPPSPEEESGTTTPDGADPEEDALETKGAHLPDEEVVPEAKPGPGTTDGESVPAKKRRTKAPVQA